jgi:hypothetical protein
MSWFWKLCVGTVFSIFLTAIHAKISINSDLEGYTIEKVTHVSDEFEGCDYDKKIVLDNGWVLTCNTYHYYYAYHPAVAILTKPGFYRELGFVSIKMLVEGDDEALDMGALPLPRKTK